MSGNPGGKPKALADVVELARTHTPAAIAALADALNNPRERVAAATVLLDRAWGKAANIVVGDAERPVEISFSWAPAASAAPMIDAVADDADTGNVVPLVTWSSSS